MTWTWLWIWAALDVGFVLGCWWRATRSDARAGAALEFLVRN